MIKEDNKPDFVKNEEKILKFWEEKNIFEKLKNQNKNSDKYFAFLDGPITANHPMGLHHALGRSLKDAMLKYKALRGYDSHYQNGFDVHGLPMEVAVEKELGINSKKEIENMGIDKFTEACMAKAKNCGSNMTERSIRLGQWMNWDDSYYTNSDENINAIWYFFKKCHEKGWIKESYKPRAWCVRCGTALSEHEMSDADAHKEVTHQAVFFKCPILDTKVSMLVWTTTPWTLSSNVAIAVNPEMDYSICAVKSDSRLLVVSANNTKVLKDDLIKVVKVVKGSVFLGKTYETCFPEFKEQKFEHKIVAWDQVTPTEGTGSVHIAPGCGTEDTDFLLGQQLGLKNIMPIDDAGKFYDGFGFLTGMFVNSDETRDLIFKKLKENGKLYYTHSFKHVYPHCWRCKNPLVYRLVKEWVIAVDEIRPKLIEEVKKVEWQPSYYEKRMIDWLENMGDWPISRKRYYGVPLPFYPCKHCGKLTVIQNKDELKQLALDKSKVDAIPHLHRPYIDEIKIACPNCGKEIERVKDVGDTWLDAGITPFSTKKYFTDRAFWEKNYPVDIVCEAKEQIRLWFYSLLIMGVVITGKAPYKKVKTYGMLLDQEGKKLSKSSPNNIPLNEVFEKMGADIIRYNFVGTTMDGNVKFGFEVADETRRKLLAFWNIYLFYNTYAIIDKPILSNYSLNQSELTVTDKWLIQRTNKFVDNATAAYENTTFNEVVSEFEQFIDELSNWYIRVNRRRFWKNETTSDKMNAYFCLEYAIKNTLIVMSPIIPFLTEYMWQNLIKDVEPNEAESVLLSKYNVAYVNLDDKDDYIGKTTIVRNIIATAQRLRNENQVKVKQPLKAMHLCANDEVRESVDTFRDIILSELNIKDIIIEDDESNFNTEFLTVNFKNAGFVLRNEVQQLKLALQNLNEKQMQKVVNDYKTVGVVNVGLFENLDSKLFNLEKKAKTEYIIAHENGVTVVLDLTLDDELIKEGMFRELVRQIQVLRKESGFEIDQRINYSINTNNQMMNSMLCLYGEKIRNEILGVERLNNIENPDGKSNLDIDGVEVLVKLKKADIN